MDALDYGRRFTVDAYLPVEDRTRSRADVEAYLSDLHSLLEGERASGDQVTVEDRQGLTVGVRGAEAHVVLHLFPDLGRLSLQVFSRRDILLSDLTRNLAQYFGVGRFESHLGNATKALPKERESLGRVLAGDRDYARVRLDDRHLAP